MSLSLSLVARVGDGVGGNDLTNEALGGNDNSRRHPAGGDSVEQRRATSSVRLIFIINLLQDLKANPYKSAKGTVIMASLHKSKGPVATFIVQNGTLKRGDVVVCGKAFGMVRAIFDDQGNRVDEVGPSIPVQNNSLVEHGNICGIPCRISINNLSS
ncbi:hypothetical protein LOK49_LG11G02423 [Camellia lanceoleosa]|uniref:Uncharacterized protein n=1 Tax=Camellia lanceoleosa TaxID=1840588 RepID=A0ACC0FY57_9ERIC|nr:hypothetical protein LOK49_LG11G02423 [Camellia lanceoleosa]